MERNKCSDCNRLKSKCKCGKWTLVCDGDECFLSKRPSPEPKLIDFIARKN